MSTQKQKAAAEKIEMKTYGTIIEITGSTDVKARLRFRKQMAMMRDYERDRVWKWNKQMLKFLTNGYANN